MDLIDAVARVVAKRGPAGMRWSMIAREAGNPGVARAWRLFEDMPALVEECYSRTTQGLEHCLLHAETTPGSALEKLAAFLVAALETRRERGSFLSFRAGEDLPAAQRRRLHERDLMIRTRLKRLLMRGQHDGSLALRHADSACALIFACLQVPADSGDAAEQRMWDGELVELLLAALAEPHAPDETPRLDVAMARGSCACGAVRYEVDGPFDAVSHCQCAMCRKHRGSALATLVSAPLAGFRWVAGEEAVTTYRSSTIGRRAFCNRCGSGAPLLESDTGVVFCPVGNLDGELGSRAHSARRTPQREPT
jgi:hypothetical protein